MKLLSDLFRDEADFKTTPWMVETYYPLDHASHYTRCVPTRGDRPDHYDLRLQHQSYMGAIGSSSDPNYNPWMSMMPGGLGPELLDEQQRLHHLVMSALEGNGAAEKQAATLHKNNHAAVALNVPEAQLPTMLALAARTVFQAAVQNAYHADHAQQLEDFGRYIGASSEMFGLWHGNHRIHYGRAHDLVEKSVDGMPLLAERIRKETEGSGLGFDLRVVQRRLAVLRRFLP